ncbi:MAG: hypothetical protein IAI49_06305 [Candidatus Eremiobacteraeota bacterium]|nr:hypothetical protein [Candidatus Eremiobacteraeota bacterium]
MSLSPYVRAAAIGAVTGLRSISPPAITLRAGDNVWTGLVTALAVGEFIADKFPQAPSRLSPPALIGRIVNGGACGGTVAVRHDGSRWIGVVIAASAALATSFAGYSIRIRFSNRGVLANVLSGLVEDAITIAGALAANAD